MARTESDREDLMREAIALTERAELHCDGFSESIVCGFRDQAALSLYFGQDPVYQFDADGLLRRAYVDGLLFRSQHATLAQLRRERTDGRTLLLRRDLKSDELLQFREAMLRRLQLLAIVLRESRYVVLCAIPETEGQLVLRKLQQRLDSILQHEEKWLSSSIRIRSS